MDEKTTIAKVSQVVREMMAAQGAGHGVDHVLRVVNMALHLQAQEGGDPTIVALAAWLHDIGDAKFCDGKELGAERSRQILEGCGVPSQQIEQIVHVVDNISFRKGVESLELSLEAKIVQDADRLEALGAIGIVRTIEYGAYRNRPFFLPGQDLETSQSSLAHFHQKLFKLRSLMNTSTARRLAEQRDAFMRQFVEQFLSEWNFPEQQ